MERITLVGTGAIGTSLGLALKKAGIGAEVVGFDIARGVAERAKKRGALDHAVSNLEDALKNARLVVLATPVAAMRELIEFIGPRLEEGAVVTDTGVTKVTVLQWAEQHLPRTVNFVGGHPLATTEQSGPEGSSETLFRGTLYPLCPASRAHSDAVRTVANVVETIGATPYFMDPVEHDSYTAAVYQLPALLSLSLVTATTRSPAWLEMHKMASTPYRDISRLASGDPASQAGLCATNRDNVIHWIDEAIKQLYEARTLLKEESTAKLEALLVGAHDARARWVAGVSPEPKGTFKVPSAQERIEGLILGDAISKRIGNRPGKDEDARGQLGKR